MYLHGLGGDGSDVDSINTLLDAAAVPEPYLLVGFSFGGLLAIMYAATYPDQLIPEDERERVMAEQVQFTTTVPNGRLVEVQPRHDIDLDKPGSWSSRSSEDPRHGLTARPGLDPFDCREPGRCAVVVVSGLHPVRVRWRRRSIRCWA